MSSRRDHDSARLRRLKRIGHKIGLTILSTNKVNPKFPEGGYMLSRDETFKVIIGDKPVPYCASLDQIEAYIEAETGTADED